MMQNYCLNCDTFKSVSLNSFSRFASIMKGVQPSACITCTVWGQSLIHAKSPPCM